jgi:thiosulfate dehydrogenase
MRRLSCSSRCVLIALSLLGMPALFSPASAQSPPGGVGAAAKLPDLAQLPNDKYGELVRQGHRIFTDTPRYARRYSGNALACASCHLDSGRKAKASPMWAAWGMYPAYLAKTDRVNNFEERVQQCFRFSLNGIAPPMDSPEVRAIVAYSQWLARGRPAGVELPGRGFPTLARTGSDPNPLRGKATYAKRCASCHGDNGEGRKDKAGNYSYLPLWGSQSYNKGAGFHDLNLLAGFLKANMPPGKPDLGDQDALDVAAWINLQERWPDPRKGLLQGFLSR